MGRISSSGLTLIEIGALVFTLIWLGVVVWFFLGLPEDQSRTTLGNSMGLVTTILGAFLPLALVWVAASAARTAQTMRDESARMRAAMETMRATYISNLQQNSDALKRDIDARLEQVSHAQAVLGAELAALQKPETSAELAAPARPPLVLPQQPALALETEPEADPLPTEDFIRALNFPENERDQEGFDVLRRALKHHDTARLVTAAQDLLTLLAQDGIYMDDLSVHRADPVLWRAFADGTHGADVAALGGIRDRSSLALTSGRMKDDPVFRDAIHHFLRTFDQVFAGFAATATDGELTAFANTRTARAFMLCARVAGTFD
ncbi:hypothetical protein [Jannaschia faecimaris]|nr:hypothetical protein [Jannaschia faecimaris]